MLLAQVYLPCVKDMDKFHELHMIAIAPPTYVLRVWIEALHIRLDRKYRRQFLLNDAKV